MRIKSSQTVHWGAPQGLFWAIKSNSSLSSPSLVSFFSNVWCTIIKRSLRTNSLGRRTLWHWVSIANADAKDVFKPFEACNIMMLLLSNFPWLSSAEFEHMCQTFANHCNLVGLGSTDWSEVSFLVRHARTFKKLFSLLQRLPYALAFRSRD